MAVLSSNQLLNVFLIFIVFLKLEQAMIERDVIIKLDSSERLYYKNSAVDY